MTRHAFGMDVRLQPGMAVLPSPGEDARRFVRAELLARQPAALRTLLPGLPVGRPTGVVCLSAEQGVVYVDPAYAHQLVVTQGVTGRISWRWKEDR